MAEQHAPGEAELSHVDAARSPGPVVAQVGSGGSRMQRVCFQLQVKPSRLSEYRQRHVAVWPEFLRELARTEWHNYSLFVRDDGLLIGYFETPDLAAAQAGMAATEVNSRWQSDMGDFFESLDGRPDEGFLRLTEIFNLDEQLASAASVTDLGETT